MSAISKAGSAQVRTRSILIINPNSNPAVSGLIRKVAETVLPQGVPAQVVSPQNSPFSIESDADKATVVPEVIRLVETLGAGNYRAIVMACFDDLALEQLRAKFEVPVVGTFESGLISIRSRARRFGIVTTFEGAVPGIQALLRKYGAEAEGTVRAAGLGVADAAGSDIAGAEKISRAVRKVITEDGAEAVMLGSGGLAGRAAGLSRAFGIPVIDSIEAAIRVAAAIADR